MNKMMIKIGLFFLFFLGVALMGYFLPNTLSKQAKGETGEVVIKKINKLEKNKYEVNIVKKQGSNEKELTDTDRENLDFYMVNLQKPTLTKIKAKATFKGDYTFTYKGDGKLVVVENDFSFDGKNLNESKENVEIEQDYLMTKKVKGATATFIYKRLQAKQEMKLQLHVEKVKKVVCQQIYIMDTDISMFSMKESNVKDGKVNVNVTFPHEGMYLIFFVMEINGEDVTIPYKLYVNKEMK